MSHTQQDYENHLDRAQTLLIQAEHEAARNDKAVKIAEAHAHAAVAQAIVTQLSRA